MRVIDWTWLPRHERDTRPRAIYRCFRYTEDMMQSDGALQNAAERKELFSVQIDTSLYTPGTDIDWATMALEIAQLPPGPLVVRVHLKPSTQWIERNSSQLVKGMAPYSGAVMLPYPSIFSDMWTAEAMRLITRLGKDLLAQTWFSNVTGVCLEPVEYADNTQLDAPHDVWGDYNALAEEAFTAWMWDGNKDIPECSELIPSAEWRAVGASEYHTDSPMGILSGLYNTFLAQSVSSWQATVIKALSRAIGAKCAVGVGTKGYLGGTGGTQRRWGIQLLDAVIRDAAECKCVIALEPDNWLPIDGLIARGVSVVGAYPESNPQVAFLLDDKSACWTSYNAQYVQQAQQLRGMLREMKLPVWDGLVSDIALVPTSVKLVVIANACALSAADIAALQVATRKGKRSFIYVGAMGLVNPETGEWNADRMLSVTGIPFSLQFESGSARCTWVDNKPFGSGTVLPRCVARSSYTIKYEDGENANGQRWLPSGKLHWCACAPLHPPLLREWLTEAEVTLADAVSAEVQQ